MPAARITDPATSHEAAESVKNVTATQAAILKLLTAAPMSDEDLIWYYQQGWNNFPRASESGIRSRRAELVKQGLVKDSGDRRRLQSGRNAIIWTA